MTKNKKLSIRHICLKQKGLENYAEIKRRTTKLFKIELAGFDIHTKQMVFYQTFLDLFWELCFGIMIPQTPSGKG